MESLKPIEFVTQPDEGSDDLYVCFAKGDEKSRGAAMRLSKSQ